MMQASRLAQSNAQSRTTGQQTTEQPNQGLVLLIAHGDLTVTLGDAPAPGVVEERLKPAAGKQSDAP